MLQVKQFIEDLVESAEESDADWGVEECEYGDPVVYEGASESQVNWGGCDDPRPILEEGSTYLVDFVEVHSWHTKVKLIGIQGLFNSVCFNR